MKTNEFIKKHGWTAVIEAVASTNSEETAFFESTDLEPILSKDGSTIGFNVKVHQIKYDEVKRLVESYELVENYTGLDNAKSIINHFKFIESVHLIPDGLEQAIIDVESCYENQN